MFVQVVPVVGSKKSVYQFMGMYKVRPAVPAYLTVEEYVAQSPQVRTTSFLCSSARINIQMYLSVS